MKWSLVLFTLAAACAAQPADRGSTFVAESKLVLVPTVVIDGRDRFVDDLQTRSFRVTVDRRPVPVAAVWREDVAASVVIVFDRSGSMLDAMDKERETLAALARSAYEQDEVAVVECAQAPRLAVPFTTDWNHVLDFARDLIEMLRAVQFVEHRLGIEQVHLARAAVHIQMNDGSRLGLKVRSSGPQVVGLE